MKRINKEVTNTQFWFRNFSKNLANSFSSSGKIEHKVTKGKKREDQILHIIEKLLPTRYTLEKDVTITDPFDVQSPQFDGVLLDRHTWPRLFAEENTTVVMLESVKVVFEVKSNLEKKDMDDIFSKSSDILNMGKSFKPFISAFSYECPNPNLYFFDFAIKSYSDQKGSPSNICILNKNIFSFAKIYNNRLKIIGSPEHNTYPIMLYTYSDTLLVYIYLLCSYVTDDLRLHLFKLYSKNVFSKLEGFYFHKDFLDTVSNDVKFYNEARKCFMGKGKTQSKIADLYHVARKKIGLSKI